ncbi:MAG: TonB family protein [Actinomycetota bacterium]
MIAAALAGLVGVLAAGPAQAQESTPESPKLAGSDVPVPRRTHFVMPAYPAEAVAAGLRGIVILEIVIDPAGRVGFAEVVRSVAPFDEAALAAVRQWTYEPTKFEGRHVSVRLTVPITFAIKLPEIARAEGVPELRTGAGPLVPEMLTAKETGSALLLIGADGSLLEAQITEGSARLSEALLQALRTWRFAVREGVDTLQVRLSAEFAPAAKAGDAGKVVLRLSDPRPVAAAAAAPAAAAAAATGSPAVAAAAAEKTAPAVASAVLPAEAATPTPAAPSTATRPDPGPQEEVIPAAPRAKPVAAPASAPAVAEAGVSSLRNVTLGPDIPDLVEGRRPVVPPVARIAGVTGSAVIAFSVDGAGDVLLHGADGAAELVGAARAAVASWKFRRLNTTRIGLRAHFTFASDQASARVERVPE